MRFWLRLSFVAPALMSFTAMAHAQQSGAVPKPTATPTASPTATKPAAKPSGTAPTATKPAEAKPAETKPADPKPAATKPATAKPMETKPATVKTSEVKPSEVKPNESKPKVTAPKEDAPKVAKPKEAAPVVPAPSEAEIKAAMVNPFDGKSLAAWTTTGGKPVAGWIAKDGMITLPRGVKGGNIVTVEDFGSFSLEFDWKIEKGGNSGIKYRVRNYDGKGALGIEYQIYDDPKDGPAKGSTASIYNIYAPNAKRKTKPVGEFNTAKILVRGNYIEHWLNGEMVASATIGSADWLKRVADSKFSEVKDFSLNSKGKIMLTDHSTEVTFRNMKFERLAEPKPAGNSGGRSYGRRGVFRTLFGR